MKKAVISVITLVALAVVIFNYKFLKRYYHVYFGVDGMFIEADKDNFDRGPSVGSEMPTIRGLYQSKEFNDIKSLAGENGTVFVINRSLEWCPYCMRQSIELQKNKADFDAEGIAIVMMTYDTPETQLKFINRHDIEYPILSDIKGISFSNLEVLREEYGIDSDNYGLPYPGMIVIDSDGIIKGKLFIEAYSSRVDTKAVLEFAKQHLLK